VLNLSKIDKRLQTQTVTICKAQDKGIGKENLNYIVVVYHVKVYVQNVYFYRQQRDFIIQYICVNHNTECTQESFEEYSCKIQMICSKIMF
jgi:hypothetical protein